MSESDEREAIRQRKREALESRHGDGASGDASPGESGSVDGEASAPGEPIHVESTEQFEELIAAHDVVLADFYADWCGPCQMLEPTVEEIAASTEAAVLKVDVDAHQFLAQQQGIQGVPTLFLYADGEPVKRLVGVQDASTLRGLIEQYAA